MGKCLRWQWLITSSTYDRNYSSHETQLTFPWSARFSFPHTPPTAVPTADYLMLFSYSSVSNTERQKSLQKWKRATKNSAASRCCKINGPLWTEKQKNVAAASSLYSLHFAEHLQIATDKKAANMPQSCLPSREAFPETFLQASVVK